MKTISGVVVRIILIIKITFFFILVIWKIIKGVLLVLQTRIIVKIIVRLSRERISNSRNIRWWLVGCLDEIYEKNHIYGMKELTSKVYIGSLNGNNPKDYELSEDDIKKIRYYINEYYRVY